MPLPIPKPKLSNRRELEAAIYRATHRDYRGHVHGKPAVLINGPLGTTLTPLDALNDAQLATLAQLYRNKLTRK